MRLIKMTLHNFRQYKHQEILFPQTGLIGVLGLNGAGKSTLLNAIGWCLYGKIKDVNKADIPNLSANKKEEVYVEIFFEFQGVMYHSKRDNKKTNECYLKTSDGIAYAIGASNLSSFVEENLFKMDYNAFCTCYYAEQGDFDNLVKLTPAKRVQTISKLLRIEAIDKASDEKRKQARGIKVEIDEAKRHLKNEEELLKQKSDLEVKIAENKEKILSLNESLLQLSDDRDQLLEKKKIGDVNFQKHVALQNQLKTVHSQIETLTKRSLEQNQKELEKLYVDQKRYNEIVKYKELHVHFSKKKEEMTEAKSLFERKKSLEREKGILETEISRYVTDYEKVKTALSLLTNVEADYQQKQNDISSLQQEIQTMNSKKQELNFEFRTKKVDFDKLKEMKNKFDELGKDSPCPTCERPLGEHYEDKMKHIAEEANGIIPVLKQMHESIQSFDVSIAKEQSKLSEFEKELKTLHQSVLQKNTLSTKTTSFETEVSLRKNKVEDVLKRLEEVKDVEFDEASYRELLQNVERITKLHNEILGLETSIARIPQIEATIEEVKAEIENLQDNAKKLQSEIHLLNFDEEEFSKLNHHIDENQLKIQQAKDSKTNLDFVNKSYEKDIEMILERLRENAQLEKEIKEKESQVALLMKLDEAYKQFKTDILSKLAPTLSEIMSEDMDNMTEGKYNQVEIDDEYNIYIYRQGDRKGISFFSGGERNLAALCQRLAISSLLVSQSGQNNFEMLAMDEVFGSLDNGRQDNVIDMLRSLNEKFPQIIIVTHSENLKDMFDFTIEIKQDSKGNSIFQWSTPWDEEETNELLEQYVFDDFSSDEEADDDAEWDVESEENEAS